MRSQRQLLVVCAYVCALPAFALDPRLPISQYQKRNWQVEAGLPHNYVMSVRPGPSGYLLVGTDEGLARFDGVQFAPFDLDPSLNLSRRWILTMMTAGDGSLWTGTFDGGLYQWRDGKVLRRFEAGASVFAVAEDASGRMWASTRNGVLRTQGTTSERVPHLSRPPDTAWNVLTTDEQGSVWVVTIDGLFRCSGGSPQLVMANGAATGEVLAVYAMPDGVIAIGTSTGLYTLPSRSRGVAPHKQSNAPGPIVSLLQDRDKNLWIGTWGKGLFRLNSTGIEGFGSREGLPDVFVRTLFEDADGNLWIGVRGGGLSRWKNPGVIPIGIPEGLSGDFASTVALDRSGTLWLGTWRGGLYKYRGGALTSEPIPVPTLFFTVRAFAIDSRGKPWVGNWEGITRFDSPGFTHFGGSDTPYQHVSCMLFDRSGRLWVGTSDNGTFVFPSGVPEGPPSHLLAGRETTALQEDSEGNIWVGLGHGAGWISPKSLEYHPVVSLRDDAIAGVSLDSKQRVWACTLGGALWQLDTRAARFVDSRAGLPRHPLYRALDDGAGSLWVSSPKGILRVPVAQLERALDAPTTQLDIETYTLDDGMRTIECHRQSQPAGGRDANGDLWFPTTKGFVRIHPGSPRKLAPPTVIIEQPGSTLRLDAEAHNVEIPFTAVQFSSPEKVKYRYRMDGFDPDWIDAGGSRTARYSALPPGEYRFLVSARVPGGQWSEPAGVTVQQLPKFYQTMWFYVLMLFTGAAAATGLFRWRLHLVRERYAAVNAERNRIGLEWHDTLVAGFSAISLQLDAALQRLGGPSDGAREIIEVTRKMVHHYRAEARRVIWDLRDTRPDTESLVDAIQSALHQATHGKPIAGTISVSGDQLDASKDVEHNLLRICQEAVTNAVRHGRPENINIDIDYTPRELRVRIVDDGKGFVPDETSRLSNGHFGLTVMQERVRRFGGRFHLTSEPGQGTTVEASVPLKAREQS